MTSHKRGGHGVRSKPANRPWTAPASTAPAQMYHIGTYTASHPSAHPAAQVPDPAAAAESEAEAAAEQLDAEQRNAEHCLAHTGCPDEPHAWAAWAHEMGKTHHPAKCAGCGLYKIWEKK